MYGVIRRPPSTRRSILLELDVQIRTIEPGTRRKLPVHKPAIRSYTGASGRQLPSSCCQEETEIHEVSSLGFSVSCYCRPVWDFRVLVLLFHIELPQIITIKSVALQEKNLQRAYADSQPQNIQLSSVNYAWCCMRFHGRSFESNLLSKYQVRRCTTRPIPLSCAADIQMHACVGRKGGKKT